MCERVGIDDILVNLETRDGEDTEAWIHRAVEVLLVILRDHEGRVSGLEDQTLG